MIDLSAKSAAEVENEGVELHLKDVAGVPLYHNDEPVTLTVVGDYSHIAKAARETIQKKYGKRAAADRDYETETTEQYAMYVIGWTHIYAGTTPVPCTKANVLKLFEVAPWIVDEVFKKSREHAAFFATRSTD